MKARAALRFVAGFPVTIALVLLTIGLTLFDRALGRSADLQQLLGISPDALSRRDWLSLLTSDVIAASAAELVLVVAATTVAVGIAERAMGSLRTLLAFVVTGVVGTVVGLLVQEVGFAAGEYWAHEVTRITTFDPFTPVVGTIATASAFLSAVWRRRVRTVLLAGALAFLLYSGRPADLYLALGLAVGLGLGALLAHRRPQPVPWRTSARETRVQLALVATVLALGPLIAVFSGGRYGLLSPLGLSEAGSFAPTGSGCGPFDPNQACLTMPEVPPAALLGRLLVTALPLVVLLVAARGLATGRRAAVWIVAGLAVGAGVLAFWYFAFVPLTRADESRLPAGSPELIAWTLLDGLVPLALAAVLILQRRAFPVRAAPTVARRAALTIGGAALATAGAYVGLAWSGRSGFTPVPELVDLLADLPERYLPGVFLRAEHRAFAPNNFWTSVLYHGVGPVFWAITIVAVAYLLHRVRPPAPTPGSAAAVRSLLREGGGSLAYLATWPGNRWWIAPDGDAAIAYRVQGGFAITTSDPVGRPADLEAVLAAFVAWCDERALTAAFYSVHEPVASILRDRGWQVLPVAEETVLDPAGWDPVGGAWKDIRTAVNRAAREGIRVRFAPWRELPTGVTEDIRVSSEAWVRERRLPELGFTLGGLAEVEDPEVLVGVALGEDDEVHGVVSWLPVWSHGRLVGRTLDFMRRAPGGMPGAMELLIAESIARFKGEHLGFASLSGAPLATASTGSSAPELPPALRGVLALVGRAIEPAYGFRSLLAFKRKFHPRLEPMWLAVQDPLALPAVGVAVARCYLPGVPLRRALRMIRA